VTWQVHWTLPLAAAPTGYGLWTLDELRRREAGARIGQGSPFMTDPDGQIDPTLTAYFNSASFRRLADSSQHSYTDDYRTFFNFLWPREKRWLKASVRDFEDYEDWRRRAPENPRPIGGSKWVRERAALKRLYDWAQQQRLIDASPIRTVMVRGRDGSMAEVAEAVAHDVRSSNVKWLTPRMSQLWRDVGLLGLTRDGVFDATFRGRNGDRNAAFADLLFDSGLRRTEGASLLTLEVPVADGRSRYLWSRVATAVAKYRSGRAFPVSSATLTRIRAYERTARADAVAGARLAGRYDAVPDKWVLTRVQSTARATTLEWAEEQTGQLRQMPLDRLRLRERMRLFKETDAGLEPLWFWLGENGMPFQSHSWEQVFTAATRRCATVIGDGAPYCTPHMARHSFALMMLVAMQHAMDTRFAFDEQQRRDYELLYGNPWRMVKDLLGHKSEETTRNVYLAPVRDVQIRTLLEGDLEQGVEFLQALAAASGRVQDVPSA
jgi:integrase